MGGETTVTVRNRAKGSRNQSWLWRPPRWNGNLAVVFSLRRRRRRPDAGAIITGDTARLARSYGIDPIAYLLDNSNTLSSLVWMNSVAANAEPHLITTGSWLPTSMTWR
jgi:glycerate-2-kinase